MRNVIMWNLMSLDGFFEGATAWDLDFHAAAWGDELAAFSLEQAADADTLLFGRKTYQGMAAYWPTAEGAIAEFMNSATKVVFSTTLDNAEWNNTRVVVSDAAQEVTKLKEQSGKSMLIFGSAALSASLAERGLIDEYRVCLVPTLLGSGTPLFKPKDGATALRLVETRPLRSGAVVLRYRPKGGGAYTEGGES